jgi:hypothetical protein
MQIEDEPEELFGRGMDDFALVMTDKCEELYGQYGAYSEEAMVHVNAIVSAYTLDEFAAALEQAKARRGPVGS